MFVVVGNLLIVYESASVLQEDTETVEHLQSNESQTEGPEEPITNMH